MKALSALPLIVLGFAVLATPAAAQAAKNADTLREVIARGIVMEASGLEIDIAFTPDGRWTAFKGLAKGAWKISGEKMCSTPDDTGLESCAVYPAGKKSGDAFMINTPDGEVKVRIL